MGASDISTLGMILAYVPLLITVVVFRMLRLRMAGTLLVSVGRMSVQLALVGLYLTVLFRYNHPALNVGYVLLMTAVANYSVLRSSGLSLKFYAVTLPALVVAIVAVLSFYTLLVFRPEPLYDARYMIPIAGMLLGNSMNRTIVTVERFYSSIRRDREGFAAYVTFGATVREAATPYLRSAYRAGIAPVLANTATMGLVSLPGMMTGQILGGSEPAVAIKYQIAIILAIFAATELATVLSVLLSLRRGFDRFGFLRTELFERMST
ncbi:MAG: ABC transporter permease [Pseudomonadota bacterium]